MLYYSNLCFDFIALVYQLEIEITIRKWISEKYLSFINWKMFCFSWIISWWKEMLHENFCTFCKISYFLSKVLYMSYDKFLLAVESCDLSQADKSIIRVSSFPNWVMSSGTSFSVSHAWGLNFLQNEFCQSSHIYLSPENCLQSFRGLP